MKPIYKANDGSEHATAAIAKAHNDLIEASDAFREAARRISVCLGAKALTADTQAGRDVVTLLTIAARRRWREARELIIGAK